MQYPKLVILSDGDDTAVLFDGVCIGAGLEQLDFTTEPKPTISLLKLNVKTARLQGAEALEMWKANHGMN